MKRSFCGSAPKDTAEEIVLHFVTAAVSWGREEAEPGWTARACGIPEPLLPVCLMGKAERFNFLRHHFFFLKENLFTTVYIICKGFCFTFAPSMTFSKKKSKTKKKQQKKHRGQPSFPVFTSRGLPLLARSLTDNAESQQAKFHNWKLECVFSGTLIS